MKYALAAFFFFKLFSASSQPGTLDPTFGTSGKAFYSLSGLGANSGDGKMIVLPNGEILQCFTILSLDGFGNQVGDFALIKYQKNGAVDPSFGINGQVTTDFNNGDDHATSIGIQSNGDIIVGGYSFQGGDPTAMFALARYTANGQLDGSFGTNGTQLINIANDDYIFSLSIGSQDQILVAGMSSTGGPYEFALACFTKDGNSLDTNFGTSNSGFTLTSIGSNNSIARKIIILSNGLILLGGQSDLGISSTGFTMVRYTSNGLIDNSFGPSADGIVTTPIGNASSIYDLALEGNNKILAAGSSDGLFALAQYTSNGILDGSNFNPGLGWNRNAVGLGGNAFGMGLLLQNDGNILVGGFAKSGAGDNDFAIARYTPTGQLDGSFNSAGAQPGVMTYDINNGSEDVASAVCFQNANILLGGVSQTKIGVIRISGSTIILPLTLIDFTARRQSSTIDLKWQTAGELNTASFEVQKSIDGNHFYTFKSIASVKNNSNEQDYGCSDEHPYSTTNFYRLKMIDQNGSFSYSKIVSILYREDDKSITLYPNPAKEMITLNVLNYEQKKLSIEIWDQSGRKLVETQKDLSFKSSTIVLMINQLPKGIYFLKIDQIKTIPFIKN